LREVIDRLPQPPSTDLAGIVFTDTEGLQTMPKRPVLRDLGSLPLPAWDLIDPEPYREIWKRSRGFFSLNVATTRGCPFKCNWCAKPIYGNRYNSRSPAHVVRELQWLTELFAPDHFWMCDDIFGLKPGWVPAFRDELRRAGLRIRFKIQSRADLLLEGDTIDALVESGLDEVWIGAESGSQKILDAMDKGITVDQIRDARRLLKDRGVRVGFFLQFGYLGETDDDIDATIRMIEELRPDDIGISVSYPLPGTGFFERVKDDLGSKANWTDSDDLAMMFRQHHRPEFYKRLHRYVHKRFRRGQALHEWHKALHGTRPDLRRALSAAYYLPAASLDELRLAQLR
jgi:anaerobic magnesium-protoporphyrin IX monomethyl ester cyclase